MLAISFSRVAGAALNFVAQCLVVSLLAFGARYSSAQEASTSLEEINQQVEQFEGQLKELDVQQTALENEFKLTKISILNLRSKGDALQKKIDEQNNRRSQVLSELRAIEQKIDKIKAISIKRFRIFYMNRKDSAVERLFSLANSERFVVNALFLRRVEDFDRQVLTRLAALHEQKSQRDEELKKLLAEQAEVKLAIVKQSQALQAKLQQQELLVRQIKEQKADKQTALAQLRAQALRLETVVASLTGANLNSETASNLSRAPEAQTGDEAPGRRDAVPYDGQGLKNQKGKLFKPVYGSVLQRYGSAEPSEFEDFVVTKGVNFKTDAGARVSAIADGKVIFVGRMPRLGTVAIIDHGARYYSLYGRMGEVAVSKGQVISRGDEIGSAGQPDSKGRNLYFEIREQGKTVDPGVYFPQGLQG